MSTDGGFAVACGHLLSQLLLVEDIVDGAGIIGGLTPLPLFPQPRKDGIRFALLFDSP